MGNQEFVVKDLQEFEDKAVFYYEHPGELKMSEAAIMDVLQTQAGIFDGNGWVDAVLRCTKQAISLETE